MSFKALVSVTEQFLLFTVVFHNKIFCFEICFMEDEYKKTLSCSHFRSSKILDGGEWPHAAARETFELRRNGHAPADGGKMAASIAGAASYLRRFSIV
jgi:hypothetical protein